MCGPYPAFILCQQIKKVPKSRTENKDQGPDLLNILDMS